MLRHPSDWRTLLHVSTTGVVAGATLFGSWLWWPLYTVMAVHVVAAQHNHAHRPVFRRRGLNLLFDHATAILCGMPMFCWRIHHLKSHHAAPWTDDDWSSPYRSADGRRPGRLVSYRHYQLTYLVHFWGKSVRWALRQHAPRARRVVASQVGSLAGVSAVLATVAGPAYWLATVPTCYLICGMALGAVNYMQHWGSWLPEREEHGAWTFTSRVHNFLNYNAGYHMLHHARPHLHWSDLPAAHAVDPSYAPAHLVEHRTFPAYLPARQRQQWLQARAPGQGAVGNVKSTL